MILSTSQGNAIKKVKDWFNDPFSDQVFKFFGHAGSGKTTLAKHFSEGIDGTVLFCSFTGKATFVLKSKGCPNTSTIHSLIYLTKPKSKKHLKELQGELDQLITSLMGKGWTKSEIQSNIDVKKQSERIEAERKAASSPSWVLNPDSEAQYAELIVVDEVSMVGQKMAEDLLSFGTKVLVLGDPAQLPPVMSKDGIGYFMKGKPDILLTEIHRQAKDNPILWLATQVREGRGLAQGKYGESEVTGKITAEDAMGADQILVGRNKSRHAHNRRIRELLGFNDPLPLNGDRVICLHNNHEAGLLNGSQWKVNECKHGDERSVMLGVEPELVGMGLSTHVLAHKIYFEYGEPNIWEKGDYEQFAYGYAITVHKSQGSQWDNVLLMDESRCFRKDAAKWLYTGLTRAAEKIKVVQLG